MALGHTIDYGIENYTVCSEEEASRYLRGCQNTSKFWRGFSDEDVDTLVEKMDFIKVKSGETIISEDDLGHFEPTDAPPADHIQLTSGMFYL